MESLLETQQRNENWSEEDKMLDPNTSEQHTTIKTKPNIQNYGPKNKKIKKSKRDRAVLQIAKIEVACRKELHEVQMANERQKLKNLHLEEEILKYKLEFYKNKLN